MRMHVENVNYVATGTALASGAGATATASGWIGQVNEYIPLVMGIIAIISTIVSILTYLEKRKQTKIMEKEAP